MAAKKAADKAAVKAADNGDDLGDPVSKFGEYDLDALGIPMEARPRDGQTHLGHHGYTIHSKSGADLCLQQIHELICVTPIYPLIH